MPALIRLLRRVRRAPSDDRGAVATVVAILLAGGVLLGSLAIVVDIGQLYAEREELQSGADAAAIAAAIQCAKAKKDTDCSASELFTLALGHANANARDGAADVLEVCGTLEPSTLEPCSDAVGNYTDCIPATPTDDRPYVEVRTRTKLRGGEYLLPPTFAQALAGNADFEGTTVGACARATYGPPASGVSLAVTVSPCEFDQATLSGGTRTYGPSTEGEFFLHSTSKAMTCSERAPGYDFPGGFGWLDESTPCQAFVTVDSVVGGNTGGATSKDCKEWLPKWRSSGAVVLLPVYDGIRDRRMGGGGGAFTEYHLKGLAGFVVTGYNLPGLRAESIITPGFNPCSGDEHCIYGYFTDDLVPATGGTTTDDGADFGVTAVTLIG